MERFKINSIILMSLKIPSKHSGDRVDGMDGLMNKIPQSGCVTWQSRKYESDLAHLRENRVVT